MTDRTWKHRLLEKDLDALTGVCVICGPTVVRMQKDAHGKLGVRCAKRRPVSQRLYGGLDHYARCARVGCMDAAIVYLGAGVPLCAEHVHAVATHLKQLGTLPAKPKTGQCTRDPARPSLVYYGLNGDRVKIGSTYSPARRWESLRKQHGAFEVLVVEPGGQREEYRRHAEFVEFRVGASEWFRLEGTLRDHITHLTEDRPDWRQLVEQAHARVKASGTKSCPPLRYA